METESSNGKEAMVQYSGGSICTLFLVGEVRSKSFFV